MKKERDIKRHFEAILGRRIDLDLDGEITVRERVGLFDWEDDGFVTSRDIGTTGALTKGCGTMPQIDVGGWARTGADGTVEFLLSDFYCPKSDRICKYPVIFVATPQSRTPVTLTSIQGPTSKGDVRITVYSWDTTGAPAPHTSFDWRCRVPWTKKPE